MTVVLPSFHPRPPSPGAGVKGVVFQVSVGWFEGEVARESGRACLLTLCQISVRGNFRLVLSALPETAENVQAASFLPAPASQPCVQEETEGCKDAALYENPYSSCSCR